MTANFYLPFANSPLGGAQHGSPETVLLGEKPFVPSFDLRISPQEPEFSAVGEVLGMTLPSKVGQTQSGKTCAIHALCLGPDWWLILGEIDAMQLLDPLRKKAHLSVVDVSAQRTHIETEGPKARHLLEHVWEQDLRENHFTVGSCANGIMAKTPAVLWHRGTHRYSISVRSSFAAHLWAALVDASVEYT